MSEVTESYKSKADSAIEALDDFVAVLDRMEPINFVETDPVRVRDEIIWSLHRAKSMSGYLQDLIEDGRTTEYESRVYRESVRECLESVRPYIERMYA